MTFIKDDSMVALLKYSLGNVGEEIMDQKA
jgi:hypothetical protein